MSVLIGLDPGGADAFGWCVATDTGALPLRVRKFGVADDAAGALASAVAELQDENPVAVGIDAPLFWTTDGDRAVDAYVRSRICALGASGGTVGHVNSLRGACLVQGMLAAVLGGERFAGLRVTESHPKALLWLLGMANRNTQPRLVTGAALRDHIAFEGQREPLEHERDAALGALSAWAMMTGATAWQNIAPKDARKISLILSPEYWVPID